MSVETWLRLAAVSPGITPAFGAAVLAALATLFTVSRVLRFASCK